MSCEIDIGTTLKSTEGYTDRTVDIPQLQSSINYNVKKKKHISKYLENTN